MIHIVLFRPEIPQNTGNIMRTCAATKSHLHIIGPIPFSIDEKSLKRAGMDYINDLKMSYYASLEEFEMLNKNASIYYITRYGNARYDQADYGDAASDIYVMFGRESTGIPHEILQSNFHKCLRLPMSISSRSLNLSNVVAIITYEILRHHNFYGLSSHEVIKGEDFISSGGIKNEKDN